jgi:hypothetical protein
MRHLCVCTDVPLRDLIELTGMDVAYLTPTRLLRRIKAHLSRAWEELADDNILCHLMRVSGREVALANMVIPLVILLEMWCREPSRIASLFHHLASTRMRLA